MKTYALLGLAALATLGHADLVGLSSNFFHAGNGGLYTFNTASGAATRQVDVTSQGNYIPTSIVGLAYLDGTLYGSDVFGPSSVFGSIDPNGGAYHDLNVNLPNGAINLWSLAPDPLAHVLYTTDGGGSDDPNDPGYSPYRGNLLAVDPLAGTTLDLGKTHDGNGNNTFMDAMAYDSTNNVLYGWNGSDLYSVNTATALVTFVGNTGGPGFNNGGDMTYDASSGTMYAIQDNDLYTVDTATAALTFIGNSGSAQKVDGLAIGPAPVPEPASMLALGVGASALLRRRRKA